ncbi:MFS transporter [Actinomadura sp. J1-007]|nr:MFS transporter [Actinomadura sp. J1-007]
MGPGPVRRLRAGVRLRARREHRLGPGGELPGDRPRRRPRLPRGGIGGGRTRPPGNGRPSRRDPPQHPRARRLRAGRVPAGRGRTVRPGRPRCRAARGHDAARRPRRRGGPVSAVLSRATAPITRLAGSIFILGLGTGLVLVGLPLLILHEYGTGLGLGLVIGLRILPNFLLGPSVGGYIDARDPRRIAIVASLASAAFTVLMPLTSALWQLCVLAVALGLTSMFTGPARMALRSWLIPEGREMDGNASIVTAERVPDVLGPAMVGPLLVVGDLDWLFYGGGLLTVLACVPLLGLGRMPRSSAPEPAARASGAGLLSLRGIVGRLFTDNARSLAEVVRVDGTLSALTITGFTYVFALGVGRIFLSEYSIRHFPSLHGALGYLMAAMAFGGILGSIAAPG